MTVLVTGAAGFIGAALSERLLAQGARVVGVDSLNSYYDPALKQARLQRLVHPRFSFHALDVAEADAFAALLQAERPQFVVHLAAQAGVRYSLDNPFAYERANVAGHLSVLEAVRHAAVRPRLLYASSSSVYGDRPLEERRGFREDDPVDAPASLYAATKRACELLSGAYARLYGLAPTGLRFFTVYGPWGRPDMAYFSFTEKMLAGEAIEVFGQGRMARDFTYIDDIIDGIVALMDAPQPPDGEHRLFNIGDSSPRGLMEMISILERALGVEAKKVMLPMQPGDVTSTYADISRLSALTGYAPKVPLEEGLERFVAWRRAWRAA
jgi:UDP-glucuronate 4-epimerase